MKKVINQIIVLFLSICMALTLSACGEPKKGSLEYEVQQAQKETEAAKAAADKAWKDYQDTVDAINKYNALSNAIANAKPAN